MSLPDLFDGCYEGEHRKAMSPEEFTQTFCSACMNAGCQNSILIYLMQIYWD